MIENGPRNEEARKSVKDTENIRKIPQLQIRAVTGKILSFFV